MMDIYNLERTILERHREMVRRAETVRKAARPRPQPPTDPAPESR